MTASSNPIPPATPPRIWYIEIPGRIPTANKQRGRHAHWSQTAEDTARYRRLGRERQQNAVERGHAPISCTAIEVTACQLSKDRRWLQDLGGCFPAVKAAIDGLVDAGLIPNDTHSHLQRLSFAVPIICGRDALQLQIKQVSP